MLGDNQPPLKLVTNPPAEPDPESPPPWASRRGIDSVLEDWLSQGRVKPCLAAEHHIDAQEPTYGPIPEGLSPALVDALKRRGVTSLYSHQSLAIEAAMAHRHVVIATPTASGKSLCFHLPVLQALAADESASALYLYPTKALSRDQESSVQELAQEAKLPIPAMVFDGDTPGDARRAVRERGRIVLTNPDMLHAGILPNHARWASLFQNLKYVVLDELHTYRGVFGSHMAHVIARLRRIANFHGSDPVFICATATIGNPREHGARLLGVQKSDIALVNESGAPQSSREVFLYNPPIVQAELGIRGSALKHAVYLASDLIEARVPSIVFAPSRNSVEVILKYLRDRAEPEVREAIMGYRGGYLPETRRNIERGLRSGSVLCVVATNALELGIDIGDLDAVICVGYPGSVAGTWQRFGRAGRRGKTSIAVMVCNSSAVDQYLARAPDFLLTSQAEEARIDPNNVEVVIQHLKCATFEAPFEITSPGHRLASPELASGEEYAGLDAEATRDALEYLVKTGLVCVSGDRYHWASEAYPATHVSLRNIGWDNFVIIDVETEQSIAELDWRATHTMLHEQAIYQHDALQFQVEKLDFENHKAFVRKVKPDYFTTALTYRTVEVIEEEALDVFPASSEEQAIRIGFGEVKVIEKVTGYKKIKYFTHENAGYGDVHLPEMQMHTTSFWLTLPEAFVESLNVGRAQVLDAFRGAGAALETVATLALMCDPQDVNRTIGDGSEDAPGRNALEGKTGRFDPTLFLFDAQPGGVGLSKRIYERANELISRARTLITECQCQTGCPACIQPTEQGGSRKALAVALLGRILV